MKLRTSFFNPTAFKKDVTRFAPAWALYTLFLLLMMTVVVGNQEAYYRTTNLAELLGLTAIIAMCYALLNAQLLFGDLYNTRLCNALHAMPLRRECWFVTHTAAGLAFALIPNLLVSLITMTMLGAGWSVALWWLLAASLQYLFFFGLAVCSALCVGNRFAQVLVYGLVNFLSLLVFWFAAALYEPLLTGVRISEDTFLNWCPVYRMVSSYDLVNVIPKESTTTSEYWMSPVIDRITLGEGWGYLALCAVIGVALLGVALALYRRRKLESAGDFMAVRALEPVFLVLYSLTAGAFFHIFAELFGSWGSGGNYCFLAVGLAVGFFTGRMLLKRSLRVFQPKAFLGLAALAIVLVLSLVLTALDIFGIARRIPQLAQVESVTIQTLYGETNALTLDDSAEIQNILDVHRAAINGETQQAPQNQYNFRDELCYVELSYTLENGSTLTRYYSIETDSHAGQILESYFTSVECVLGVPEAQLDELTRKIDYLYVDSSNDSEFSYTMVSSLLEAIAADCKAGNMAQPWAYHPDEEYVTTIQFEYPAGDRYQWVEVVIYDACENTVQWLKDQGLYNRIEY